MINHTVSLDYQLTPGWMTPYIQGLLDGHAIARQCSGCRRTSFPPVRVCHCGQSQAQWIQLSGDAKLVYRTQGSDGDFALVHFDGADTRTVVMLSGFNESQLTGQLRTLKQSLPALILHPAEACKTL